MMVFGKAVFPRVTKPHRAKKRGALRGAVDLYGGGQSEVGPFFYVALRLDYSAGIPARFPLRLTDNYFNGGLSDPFFIAANDDADAGDYRIYKSDGTRIPFEKNTYDRNAASIEAWSLNDAAMALDDYIVIRVGGTLNGANLQQPATDALYGAESIWSDYNLVTHTLDKNSVNSQNLSVSGAVARAGSNGLTLKGFGTKGTGAGDYSEGPIAYDTVVSYSFVANQAGNGMEDNFGRWFQNDALGDELLQNGNNSLWSFEREFDQVGNKDGRWTFTRPPLNTETVILISHDGGVGLPDVYFDGVAQVVTEAQAPTGTVANFSTDDVTMFLGSHNGHNKTLDGIMGEFTQKAALTNAAFAAAHAAMLKTPSTFMRATQRGSSFPSFVPSYVFEQYLDQLSDQPDLAQKIRLDDNLFKPLRDEGFFSLIDFLNVVGHSREALLTNVIAPGTYTWSRVGPTDPAFTAYDSVVFDGSHAYDTGYQPPAGQASRNSCSIGIYVTANAQFGSGIIGAARTTGDTVVSTLNPRTAADVMSGKLSDLQSVTSTAGITDARGLSIMVRESSTVNKFYHTGAQLGANVTSASDADVNFSWFVGGINRASDVFTACSVFAAFGGGILSAAEVTSLTDIIDAYKASLP